MSPYSSISWQPLLTLHNRACSVYIIHGTYCISEYIPSWFMAHNPQFIVIVLYVLHPTISHVTMVSQQGSHIFLGHIPYCIGITEVITTLKVMCVTNCYQTTNITQHNKPCSVYMTHGIYCISAGSLIFIHGIQPTVHCYRTLSLLSYSTPPYHKPCNYGITAGFSYLSWPYTLLYRHSRSYRNSESAVISSKTSSSILFTVNWYTKTYWKSWMTEEM